MVRSSLESVQLVSGPFRGLVESLGAARNPCDSYLPPVQVSPEMNYRTQSDLMPHDQLEDTPLRRMLKARGNSIIESFGLGPLERAD